VQVTNRSQENARNDAGRTDAQGAFDKIVKENALWLLLEYQRSTGKKWTLICDEIVSVARPQASPGAPLLTRQDLEGWVGNASVPRDNKFSVVFDFLTADATVRRPEFRNAKDLLNPKFEMLTRGRILAALFSGPLVRSQGVLGGAIIEQQAGLYVGAHSDGVSQIGVSLNPLDGEEFLVAHLIVRSGAADPKDWNLRRWSGYATVTVGEVTLYLREIGARPRRPHRLFHLGADRNGRRLLVDSSSFQKMRDAIVDGRDSKATIARLNDIVLDMVGNLSELTPSNDKAFSDIVAEVRWNVRS
jgi:hypothetical protein